MSDLHWTTFHPRMAAEGLPLILPPWLRLDPETYVSLVHPATGTVLDLTEAEWLARATPHPNLPSRTAQGATPSTTTIRREGSGGDPGMVVPANGAYRPASVLDAFGSLAAGGCDEETFETAVRSTGGWDRQAWERFAQVARRNGMLPLVLSSPLAGRLPASCSADWKREVLEGCLRLIMGIGDLLRVSPQVLSPPLLLKGGSLAFECYAHPALRPMYDLDLLLEEADLPRLREELMSIGYWEVENEETERHRSLGRRVFARTVPRWAEPLILEAHTALSWSLCSLDTRTWSGRPLHLTGTGSRPSSGWCPILRMGSPLHLPTGSLATLPAEQHALYLAVHWIAHLREGRSPLIWLVDMAKLFTSAGFDWPAFTALVKTHRLERGVHYLLSLLESRLGAPIPSSARREFRVPLLSRLGITLFRRWRSALGIYLLTSRNTVQRGKIGTRIVHSVRQIFRRAATWWSRPR